LRVMIAGDATHSTITRFVSEAPQALRRIADKFLPSVVDDGATSVASDTGELVANDAGSDNARLLASPVKRETSPGNLRLSEREEQILNGLVKGQANKVIARTFDISEATVKVHMKSILRKIRVANRTQAAIWAMENGYCADEVTTMPKVQLTATKEG